MLGTSLSETAVGWPLSFWLMLVGGEITSLCQVLTFAPPPAASTAHTSVPSTSSSKPRDSLFASADQAPTGVLRRQSTFVLNVRTSFIQAGGSVMGHSNAVSPLPSAAAAAAMASSPAAASSSSTSAHSSADTQKAHLYLAPSSSALISSPNTNTVSVDVRSPPFVSVGEPLSPLGVSLLAADDDHSRDQDIVRIHRDTQ